MPRFQIIRVLTVLSLAVPFLNVLFYWRLSGNSRGHEDTRCWHSTTAKSQQSQGKGQQKEEYSSRSGRVRAIQIALVFAWRHVWEGILQELVELAERYHLAENKLTTPLAMRMRRLRDSQMACTTSFEGHEMMKVR